MCVYILLNTWFDNLICKITLSSIHIRFLNFFYKDYFLFDVSASSMLKSYAVRG
jgi:hypothetical protein